AGNGDVERRQRSDNDCVMNTILPGHLRGHLDHNSAWVETTHVPSHIRIVDGNAEVNVITDIGRIGNARNAQRKGHCQNQNQPLATKHFVSSLSSSTSLISSASCPLPHPKTAPSPDNIA